MNKLDLQRNVEKLVNKYIIDEIKKKELISLIKENSDSAKYVLYEIDNNKKIEFDKSDLEIIKDIAFYYI